MSRPHRLAVEPIGPLDLVDLLIPFDAACAGAVAAAREGDLLDASLLVAGCGQVVEDHIHRSEGLLDRVAVHLGDSPTPGRASVLAGATGTAVRVAHRARPSIHRLLPRRDGLLELAIDLSRAAGDDHIDDATARALSDRVDDTLGPRASWPSELGPRVLRLPSSFRSFDQQPADVQELAKLAAERWPDPDHPILIVGIRTSGSYLGPIAVAELRRLGHRRVELISMRAGERLDRMQAAAVDRAKDGTVLLIDDPPVSGLTVRDCIAPLVSAGIDPDRVALLLPLPDDWVLAPFLDRYEQIVLRSSDWRIQALLEPEALAKTADALLAARGEGLVGSLGPAVDPVGAAPGGAPRTAREHQRRAYTATTVDAAGLEQTRVLVAQGVGVGLFGRHDLAVAARLDGLVPDCLGVVDGVLLQLLDPPEASAGLGPSEAAGYVFERHRSLPAVADRSADMRGRKAVWEIGAMLAGGALGQADVALRIALVQPVVRRILEVERPSIIDGRMSADRFLRTSQGSVAKADFADGAFSNRDLWSYDPVYDLAAIGDDLGRPSETLVEWERRSGESVDPSRWMLLRLVAAWDRHRHGALPQPMYGRLISQILTDHVGALYVAGLPQPTGPWCATDVDGVLETAAFSGASATGRLGAEAMRALIAHGYRVVPVTGRSVAEVSARCAAWGLAVGIAEYGSGMVLDGRPMDLRTDEERVAVERARAWLAARPDVIVDPAYALSVRAWRIDGRDGRVPLDASEVTELESAMGGAIAVVRGEDQIDVIAAGVSKHRALRAMLARVDPAAPEHRPLAFAAGDGPADVGMLGLASLSVAPAHARAEVEAAASAVVGGAYQAGLADGVALLLGHRPGGCPTCAPSLPLTSDALVEVLSVHEAGPRGIAPRVARLAKRVVQLR